MGAQPTFHFKPTTLRHVQIGDTVYMHGKCYRRVRGGFRVAHGATPLMTAQWQRRQRKRRWHAEQKKRRVLGHRRAIRAALPPISE